MGHFSAKVTSILAHKTNAANPPDWYEEALKEKKIRSLFQSTPDGFVQTGISVETFPTFSIISSGDYVIKNTDGTFRTLGATVFEQLYAENHADLLTVLTKTVNPLLPVNSINVANSVATVGLTDLTVSENATVKLYSDAYTTEVTGANTISLTAGTAVPIYVKVTSSNRELVNEFEVNILRAAT